MDANTHTHVLSNFCFYIHSDLCKYDLQINEPWSTHVPRAYIYIWKVWERARARERERHTHTHALYTHTHTHPRGCVSMLVYWCLILIPACLPTYWWVGLFVCMFKFLFTPSYINLRTRLFIEFLAESFVRSMFVRVFVQRLITSCSL